jgi:hypothetical protein
MEEQQRMWTAKEENVSMCVYKFTASLLMEEVTGSGKDYQCLFCWVEGIVIPILSEAVQPGGFLVFFLYSSSWHFRFCFSP